MAEQEEIVVRKPWDKRMKRLFWAAPQDFVDWLLPGSQFRHNLSSELENETLYTDLLFELEAAASPYLSSRGKAAPPGTP